MNPFYKLNETLASIGKEQDKIAEQVAKTVEKTPARKTLEESLRSDMKSLMEGAKPDFLDMDKDGNKKESMKKAVADKKKNPFAKKKVKEDGMGGLNMNGLEEEGDKWIQKANVKKGGLHKALHVPQGETIPKGKIEKASHSKNAHLRHMAQFAKNVANESQLNEYMIEPGDVDQIFQLNLFNDLIGENALTNDPEWKQNPKWMAVVKEFKPVALQLANEIRANKDKNLSDEEAEELDSLWYDGSDAYEGPDAGADWLRGAYKRQARAVSEILSGLAESGAGGIHGNFPDPMTQKDQQKKMNPPASLEEGNGDEMMEFIKSKLAPATTKQYNGKGRANAVGGIEFESDGHKPDWLIAAQKRAERRQGKEVEEGELGTAVGAGLGGAVGGLPGAALGGIAGHYLTKDEPNKQKTNEGMPTRKHFQQVADVVRQEPDPEMRRKLADHHCSIFSQQNSKFNPKIFKNACGVIDECDWAAMEGHDITDEGWDDAMALGRAAANQKPAFRNHDVKDTGYSKVYTRKPDTFIDDPRDEEPADGVKRGRGRPKGNAPVEKRKTKGAYKHKRDDKLQSKSHIWSLGKATEPEDDLDEEAVEAGKRHFFDKLAPAAKKVAKVVGKVAGGAKKEVEEKKESTAKKDTNAEKAGKKVAKDIEHDEGNKAKGDNKAEKAGKKVTKDIEYDDKKDKKEKKVDETTTAGSVATASTSSKSNSMGIGQGVYESWNQLFNKKLNESVSVKQEAMKEEGGEDEESITITATGDDVSRLKELLAGMGIEQGAEPAVIDHDHEACGTCGGVPCQCDDQADVEVIGEPGEIEFEVDEAATYGDTTPTENDELAWPTNQMTTGMNQSMDPISNDLNRNKKSGQEVGAVTPVNQVKEADESSSFLNLYKAFAKIK